MTVRAWCRENGLSEKTYYYWQRRLFQALSEQQAAHETVFAEVTPSQLVCSGKVAVTVRIAGAEADIHSGADADPAVSGRAAEKTCELLSGGNRRGLRQSGGYGPGQKLL